MTFASTGHDGPRDGTMTFDQFNIPSCPVSGVHFALPVLRGAVGPIHKGSAGTFSMESELHPRPPVMTRYGLPHTRCASEKISRLIKYSGFPKKSVLGY